MNGLPAHLAALESEAIHVLRNGLSEARNPVVLFSGGKDSTVLAHLVLRAFFPSRPPIPLLHIDSTWEFAEVLAFRDAFPLSNWTEQDLWTYILMREIEVALLYIAHERKVVTRTGMRIVVDDPARMRWQPGETALPEKVRFRKLGCWPVTAAQPSEAETSERRGRLGDNGSLERQKREAIFEQ
jgi:3'-phosphoadenosine 5'-phosphosulfate sulfotransferase (PAPS reductase)/FAD synthetase